MMRIEERFLVNYDKMNETDKMIWQYISVNKTAVKNITIDELACSTNVSRTTISRFVRKMGLKGYSEFKVLFNLESSNGVEINDTLYDNACDSIIKYVEEQQQQDYTDVCKALFEAKRIFVYGSGDIQRAVGKQIQRMFLSCQELIHDVRSSTLDISLLDMLGEGDVFILISLSGNTEKVVDIAKRLKLKGVTIITITEFNHNLLTNLSDYPLYIFATNLSFIELHPNYKVTMLYFVLAELLFIKYTIYKKKRLEQSKVAKLL